MKLGFSVLCAATRGVVPLADTPKTPKPATPRAAAKAPGKTPAMLTAAQALDAASSSIAPAPTKAPPTPKAAKVAAPPVAKAIPATPPAAPATPAEIAAEPIVAQTSPAPPAEAPAAPIVSKPTSDPVTPVATAAVAPAAPELPPVVTPKTIPAVPVEEGISKMTDVIETTKKFAEETKAKFETAFADINEKAKASVEKSTKALEELGALAKGNVEAMVESGKIAAKGVEALGQDAAEYSRKNFEKATATMKSFASIKTPAEFFQLQSELFSSSFDAFAKETAKSSEAMIKLAGDVVQPISNRVSIITDKVKSLAA
ncbi:phasin family protein [Sphingobium aquiterrae]|uniref:phasin family protein n=1 Tax=Sphingobium aquiterrae TaxID=2038656 RepID=UPI0030183B60